MSTTAPPSRAGRIAATQKALEALTELRGDDISEVYHTLITSLCDDIAAQYRWLRVEALNCTQEVIHDNQVE